MDTERIKCANKAMQQTKTARCSFSISLSHSGLVLHCGSLPVVRVRFWLLMASVRIALANNHMLVCCTVLNIGKSHETVAASL